MKQDYKPITGKELRIGLDELGYPVNGTDVWKEAHLGILLAMAQEIEGLRAEINYLNQSSVPAIEPFSRWIDKDTGVSYIRNRLNTQWIEDK